MQRTATTGRCAASCCSSCPATPSCWLLGRFSRTDVHAGSWEERATMNIAPGIDVYAGPNDNPYGNL